LTEPRGRPPAEPHQGWGSSTHPGEDSGQFSREFIVIVDDSKLVDKLGAFPVPVEVIPQAYRVVTEKLEYIGGKPRLRMAEKKDGPVITDNGNFVVDIQFPKISKPEVLEMELNTIPGVVENGIFTGIVDEVMVGTPEGLKILK